MPQPVLAKSIASPSSVAHVSTQKYQFSMPLYRQEQEWKSIGIALSRATLANWVIHADETPVQVLNEKGRKNKTRSYMWVYTNGEFVQDGCQIRIYEYHPGRNGGFAGKFLEGYAGILQTDGYAGYEQISCKAQTLCWVHARRYFVDAIPAGISQEEAAESISGQAIRNFTIGRKNWLFSASPKGAAASAAVYSIVETSKANNLEPFRYLTYLFEKLPNINFKIHPEVLEDFLPWSKEVQQKYK